MPSKNDDSKYLTLWLCVIVAAAVIIAGWIYAVKFNLDKINDEMGKSGETGEQAAAELQSMISGVSDILQEQQAGKSKEDVQK